MKKNLLTLLLMIPLLGLSQLSKDFNIELSKPYAVVDGSWKRYFPVEDGKSVISVKRHPKIGVIVQKFSVEDMAEEKRSTTPLAIKGIQFIDIVYIDDEHFYYFYDVYDKKAKNHTVYAMNINVADASLGKAEELFKTTAVITPDAGSSFAGMQSAVRSTVYWTFGAVGPRFHTHVSLDKSKIMISGRHKPLVKKDANSYDLIETGVFEKDLTKISHKTLKMPYTEKDMNNQAYGVSNKGVVYLLAKVNTTKKFELLLFKDGEMSKEDLDIDHELIFQKMDVLDRADGKILVAGYYARSMGVNVGWNGSVGGVDFDTDGIYYFVMDQDGAVTEKNKIEFPLEFIKLYLNERQQKRMAKREAKGKAGIRGLTSKDFHIQEDGSMIFVGEQSYVNVEPWGTDMSARVRHNSNMVITKITKDGELAWMKKCPKNQARLDNALNRSLGVKYIEGPKAHWLLYIDNKKNAELSPNQVPAAHKDGLGGFLTAYRIDNESGEVEKHMLFDTKDVKGRKIYQFQVTRIMQVEGGFALETYLKGKQDGMIKMWMDE